MWFAQRERWSKFITLKGRVPLDDGDWDGLEIWLKNYQTNNHPDFFKAQSQQSHPCRPTYKGWRMNTVRRSCWCCPSFPARQIFEIITFKKENRYSFLSHDTIDRYVEERWPIIHHRENWWWTDDRGRWEVFSNIWNLQGRGTWNSGGEEQMNFAVFGLLSYIRLWWEWGREETSFNVNSM